MGTETKQKETRDAVLATLQANHQQWLANPVTQSFLRLVREHKDKFVSLVSDGAMNPAIEDRVIRHYSVNIRNIDAILNLATKTEVFCEKLIAKPSDKE